MEDQILDALSEFRIAVDAQLRTMAGDVAELAARVVALEDGRLSESLAVVSAALESQGDLLRQLLPVTGELSARAAKAEGHFSSFQVENAKDLLALELSMGELTERLNRFEDYLLDRLRAMVSETVPAAVEAYVSARKKRLQVNSGWATSRNRCGI